jgi:hypothetical protein
VVVFNRDDKDAAPLQANYDLVIMEITRPVAIMKASRIYQCFHVYFVQQEVADAVGILFG